MISGTYYEINKDEFVNIDKVVFINREDNKIQFMFNSERIVIKPFKDNESAIKEFEELKKVLNILRIEE